MSPAPVRLPHPGPAPHPFRSVTAARGVAVRALLRLWGRDVMLYTGGVSFFALLAIFPGLALAVGLYSLFTSPAQAAHTAARVAELMPANARDLVTVELSRLTGASRVLSVQSALAAVVGLYAAHRGVKALLAGLSFVSESEGEEETRGFVRFNVTAALVALAGLALLGGISMTFVVVRVMTEWLRLTPLGDVSWLFNEWLWTTLGLTLTFRFAMASRRIGWRASTLGGAAAGGLALAASWLCAVYVERIAPLGATYGSIATAVVFLIWLSWNVNAVFFGGALATEAERAFNAAEGGGPQPAPAPRSATPTPPEPVPR